MRIQACATRSRIAMSCGPNGVAGGPATRRRASGCGAAGGGKPGPSRPAHGDVNPGKIKTAGGGKPYRKGEDAHGTDEWTAPVQNGQMRAVAREHGGRRRRQQHGRTEPGHGWQTANAAGACARGGSRGASSKQQTAKRDERSTRATTRHAANASPGARRNGPQRATPRLRNARGKSSKARRRPQLGRGRAGGSRRRAARSGKRGKAMTAMVSELTRRSGTRRAKSRAMPERKEGGEPEQATWRGSWTESGARRRAMCKM